MYFLYSVAQISVTSPLHEKLPDIVFISLYKKYTTLTKVRRLLWKDWLQFLNFNEVPCESDIEINSKRVVRYVGVNNRYLNVDKWYEVFADFTAAP